MTPPFWSRRAICSALTAAGGIALLAPYAARAQASPSFAEWLDAIRVEAALQGVSKATLDRALVNIQPIEAVLTLDRQQPESTMSVARYLKAVVTTQRAADARKQKQKHNRLLVELSERYHVPVSILLALWSAETYFGRNQGKTPILAATATLAHAGRRPTLFKAQFIAALKIIEAGDVTPERLIGSWAGAMGQVQFLPTSYLDYAVDYDGDGKRDIWHSVPDALASAANYLAGHGWVAGQSWGFVASVGKTFTRDGLDPTTERNIAAWRKAGLGVAASSSYDGIDARFLEPDGPGNGAYLVLPNFEVILKWNRSNHFALSIGLLADRIGR